MKRSDFVKDLERYIQDQNAGMVCAEQVLRFFESKGFLPPGHPKVIAKDSERDGIHGQLIDCLEWEPEDELVG